jgi:asparagine synthase (glutamine-hydrolysing)
VTLRNLSKGWSNYLREGCSYISRVFSEDEKTQLWRGRADASSTDALIRSWYASARSPHPSDQLQEVYCREWLVEDLLMKADKMTMASSLELRCPFLDHVLVEWAARLPLEWKVGSARVGWRSKRILREFAWGRLPGVVIERRKQGFPVPAYEWLAQGLGPWARERLLGPGARIGELFDSAPLAALLERAQSGELAAAQKVWSALILETWLRRWL